MRPSSILRALSFRIPARLSASPVAPLPVRSAFDQWLAVELNNLQCQQQLPECYTSATWIQRALNVAIATQTRVIESIAAIAPRDVGRKLIDGYLEDVVELLDALNDLRERMDAMKKYVDSLAVVQHCLAHGNGPSGAALARLGSTLGSCEAMERRCAELDKCGSSLRRLGEKLAQGVALGACGARPCGEMGLCAAEFDEVLGASKAVALLVCGMLSVSLSFKSTRGLSALTQSPKAGSWSSSLHALHKLVKEEVEKQRKSGSPILYELRSTVAMARNLRGLILHRPENGAGREELRTTVEALKRSSGELEEGIKMFEGRINELYRHLMSIRMALLDMLTMA